MDNNKKYTKHLIIYSGIGLIVFAITFILDVYSIIDIHNTIMNCIIYGIFAVFCLCYYKFIYDSFIGRGVQKGDCIVAVAIYIIIGLLEICLGLTAGGVHMCVVSINMSSLLSITVYTIIWHLRNLEEDVFVTNRKYTRIIDYLKKWANCVFIGFIGAGIVIAFYPEALAVWR